MAQSQDISRHIALKVSLRVAYGSFLAIVVLFIVVPIGVVMLTSLSPTPYVDLPPQGVSLRWWVEAMRPEWLSPIVLSLRIAFVSAIVATILGGSAAFAMVRGRIPGKSALESFIATPIILPEIVAGVALLQVIALLGAQGILGFRALVVAHVMVGIPYAARTVGVSLAGIRPEWEQAAADLGANKRNVLRYITLPLMKNGLFAGLVFAFIVSFNNVPLSVFLGRAGSQTIPIRILNYMEFRFDPALSAVAMLTAVIVLIPILLAARMTNIMQFLYKTE